MTVTVVPDKVQCEITEVDVPPDTHRAKDDTANGAVHVHDAAALVAHVFVTSVWALLTVTVVPLTEHVTVTGLVLD